MESNVCVICNTERSFDNFYNNYRECKLCNIKRSLKSYYENKDEISNQQKIYYDEKSDKSLQKQRNSYISVNELHRSYVEIQNRLKALEEKTSIKDSESN